MIKIIGLCCIIVLIVLALFSFFDSIDQNKNQRIVKEIMEEIERESLKEPK